jgi:hypothetical protein
MPTNVSKLKEKKMFLVALYILRQTLCCLALPCPFHLPCPSFSDASEADLFCEHCTRNITHYKESATIRNFKPECWGSPLAQEEKCQEKPVKREE